MVERLDGRVEILDLVDAPFAELAFVAEGSFEEAGHVVGEECNAAVDVGFDEIAVLFQAQKAR